jgi:hypothetical protein
MQAAVRDAGDAAGDEDIQRLELSLTARTSDAGVDQAVDAVPARRSGGKR